MSTYRTIFFLLFHQPRGDDEVETRFLHFVWSFDKSVAVLVSKLYTLRSSLILLIHFLRCLPLLWTPSTWHYMALNGLPDRMRNKIVREKLQQNDTIVEEIRQRRLKWFGHVMRMVDCRLPLRAMYCQVEGVQSSHPFSSHVQTTSVFVAWSFQLLSRFAVTSREQFCFAFGLVILNILLSHHISAVNSLRFSSFRQNRTICHYNRMNLFVKITSVLLLDCVQERFHCF